MFFRDSISQKLLTYAMLAFTVGWFGFFMPGHQRGIVSLPTPSAKLTSDSKPGSVLDRPRCPNCVQKAAATPEEQTPAQAPTSPDGSCAVCHIKMGLNLPPTAVTIHLDMWLLDELEPLPYIAEASIPECRLHRLGRAPPMG